MPLLGATTELPLKDVHLSYSSLIQHRECPQQWSFKRLSGIEKDTLEDDVPVEKDFGTAWHALRAADSAQRGLALGSLKYAPETLSMPGNLTVPFEQLDTPEKVLAWCEDWWSHQSMTVQETWIERIGQDLPTRLAAVDGRWRAQWALELEYEKPLAVELGWKRPLYTDTSAGIRYVLVGYIDEVFYDSKRSVVVVRDHKSHKKLGQISRTDEMLDSQLQLYAWGAAPLIEGYGHGKVQATAYDRVRMVAPKTPTLTQAGGLSKAITDFDMDTYHEWCASGVEYPGRKKDGSGAGVYVEESTVMARLSTPAWRAQWFTRSGPIPLSSHTVRAHLEAALDSARVLTASHTRYVETAQASRSFAPHCRWCDYAPLCQAQLIGGARGEYDLQIMGLRRRTAQ
jgi:hypothetical protein